MALDLLGRFFLFFTSVFWVIPLSVLGYWSYSKKTFGRLIFLVLFTIIFALYLKSIWQESLPEWMHNDSWAFPSGHLMFTVTFYGWIALELRKWWVTLGAFIIISGVAWGILHFNYHFLRDIGGAIGFGALTLIAYYLLLQNQGIQKNLSLLGGMMAPLTGLMIYLVPRYFSYVYEAQGQLMGFSLGWFLWDKFYRNDLNSREKTITILLSFGGAMFFYLLKFFVPPTPLSLLILFFLIGLSISFPGFGLVYKKKER